MKNILQKVALMSLVLTNVNADFKFKIGKKINHQEVEQIKETVEIKQNPKTNVLKVLDKQILTKEIKKTPFKIINMEKYNNDLNIKKTKVVLDVMIESSKTDVNYISYNLNSNTWYLIRKSNGLMKFIPYKPLSQKDFYKHDSYIKVNKKSLKILNKSKNEFKANVYSSSKFVTLSEIDDTTFKMTNYKLKIRGKN